MNQRQHLVLRPGWTGYTGIRPVHKGLSGGNAICVNPEKSIAVALAACFKPAVFDRVDLIREYMEPFICER